MSASARKRRWATALVALIAVGVLASRRPALPGSLGVMAAEVRVGMSRDEAIAVIRTAYAGRDREWDNPRLYTDGRTRDGQPFGRYFDWDFAAFPPANEVEWAELDIDDDRARDLLITFGPGGRVSDVRLKSCEGGEELRFALWRWLPER